MTGRVWPCHVAMMADGTGRVRVFLIISPEICGSVSVALAMQSLLSSAPPSAVARSNSKTAMANLMCIQPRSPRTKQALSAASPGQAIWRLALSITFAKPKLLGRQQFRHANLFLSLSSLQAHDAGKQRVASD